MLEAWQHFYEWHDPTIVSLGFFELRWYGLMYVTALLTGYFWGGYMVAQNQWAITKQQFESAFFWFVIGVVLGARLGYVLFYDENTLYLISHPWQIFNPFQNGKMVGISGLSYHGAIAGAVIAMAIFVRRQKLGFLMMLDLAAVSGSAGYLFGRLGNFFNAELVGRETSVAWGILVDGVLRHPSAIYEAILEGLLVFVVLFFLYKRRSFDGQMAMIYAMLYTFARFIAEFFREPDSQLGFVLFDTITMGQILSIIMFAMTLGVYIYLKRNHETIKR